MQKMVDGELVDLTPEELAQREKDEAKHEARQIELKNNKYAADRAKELVTLDGEGMDVMRKAIAAIAVGEPVPVEFEHYLQKVEVIKEKYPKTEVIK